MKKLVFVVISIFATLLVDAQIFYKTEYIGESKFVSYDSTRIDGKGKTIIHQGGIQLPLSIKMNDNNKPTIWAISAGVSYADFKNKNLPTDFCLEEMLNMNLGLIHIRPLSDRWSVFGILGAGIFLGDHKLSKIRGTNILGQGGLIFIRHLRSNLDIGGGLALNNTFGYPMVFPAFYFSWQTTGKLKVNISLINAAEIALTMELHKNIDISLTYEINGMAAFIEQDNKKKVFTHQYMVAGFRPEFKIAKFITIPLTAGVSLNREAYFQKRTLKDFFKENDEIPHFKTAPYFSVGIKIGF